MIICYSKKFVFIRIPKAASTTAALIVYDSGILDTTRDRTIGIEDGTIKEDAEGTRRASLNLPKTWEIKNVDLERPDMRTLHPNRIRHASFDSLVKRQLINNNMTCYSTIRHPIDRFISIAYFNAKYGKQTPIQDPALINEIWDKFYSGDIVFDEADYLLRIPQYTYFNDDPVLWNTENLYEHGQEFVKRYNGNLDTLAVAKYNKERSRNWDECLTKNRQTQLLEMYEKDFFLWESSYKKFN